MSRKCGLFFIETLIFWEHTMPVITSVSEILVIGSCKIRTAITGTVTVQRKKTV
jgi:hypothetical protein